MTRPGPVRPSSGYDAVLAGARQSSSRCDAVLAGARQSSSGYDAVLAGARQSSSRCDAVLAGARQSSSRYDAVLAGARQSASGFDAVFDGPPTVGDGGRHWLVDGDGRRTPLPVDRWHGVPERAVRELLDRCTGPTVDIGCGPGRLVAALAERGLVSLGIDTSDAAVRLTRSRGVPALCRDVFDPLPGEGRWAHLLLVDGNVGIGGDPAALLRRCAQLLRPGGTALIELEPPGIGLWHGVVRVVHGDDRYRSAYRGPAFRWARLGAEAIHDLAATADLLVKTVHHRDQRWFAELVRR